jgi:hypothetical protein
LRTIAVATGGVWFAELIGGVCGSGKSQGASEEREVQSDPDSESAETAEQGRHHTEVVSKGNKKKPIGQGY